MRCGYTDTWVQVGDAQHGTQCTGPLHALVISRPGLRTNTLVRGWVEAGKYPNVIQVFLVHRQEQFQTCGWSNL